MNVRIQFAKMSRPLVAEQIVKHYIIAARWLGEADSYFPKLRISAK